MRRLHNNAFYRLEKEARLVFMLETNEEQSVHGPETFEGIRPGTPEDAEAQHGIRVNTVDIAIKSFDENIHQNINQEFEMAVKEINPIRALQLIQSLHPEYNVSLDNNQALVISRLNAVKNAETVPDGLSSKALDYINTLSNPADRMDMALALTDIYKNEMFRESGDNVIDYLEGGGSLDLVQPAAEELQKIVSEIGYAKFQAYIQEMLVEPSAFMDRIQEKGDPDAQAIFNIFNDMDEGARSLLLLSPVVQKAPPPEFGEVMPEEQVKVKEEAESALKDIDEKTDPIQKERKIAQIMIKLGVSIKEETNGVLTVEVPATQWENILNKFMGIVMLLGTIKSQFSKAMDKAKFEEKTETISSNPTGLINEARSRIQQEIDGGKSKDQIKTDLDTKYAAATAEVTAKSTVEIAAKADVTTKEAAVNTAQSDFDSAINDKTAKQTALDAAKNDLKTAQDILKKATEELQKAKALEADASNEIKAMEMMKVESVPKDGKWHRGENILFGKTDWNYKVEKDGRAYAYKNNALSVFNGDKWVDATVEAGITNPEEKLIYAQTFYENGLQTWVSVDAGKREFEYGIDLPSKTLIAKKSDGTYQEFDAASNDWKKRAVFKHPA